MYVRNIEHQFNSVHPKPDAKTSHNVCEAGWGLVVLTKRDILPVFHPGRHRFGLGQQFAPLARSAVMRGWFLGRQVVESGIAFHPGYQGCLGHSSQARQA